MAIKTTQEQLEEVQAAISKVMSGQSVTIDGNVHTLASLGALTSREEKLLARYRAENGSGISINIGLHRRD